jgi:phosphatidylglycerophosphatase A
LRPLILFLATGALSGYAPLAPGTAGAAVGLVLYLAGLVALPAPLYLVTLAAGIAVAVWSSDEAIKLLGEKDPPQVTIDEVVGLLTTLALVPTRGAFHLGPLPLSATAILGFLFFRFFDILKPFPIRDIERRAPGGWGVVLDDVAAGVYANLLLRIALRFLPFA